MILFTWIHFFILPANFGRRSGVGSISITNPAKNYHVFYPDGTVCNMAIRFRASTNVLKEGCPFDSLNINSRDLFITRPGRLMIENRMAFIRLFFIWGSNANVFIITFRFNERIIICHHAAFLRLLRPKTVCHQKCISPTYGPQCYLQGSNAQVSGH